jgi:hypothetical protein
MVTNADVFKSDLKIKGNEIEEIMADLCKGVSTSGPSRIQQTKMRVFQAEMEYTHCI